MNCSSTIHPVAIVVGLHPILECRDQHCETLAAFELRRYNRRNAGVAGTYGYQIARMNELGISIICKFRIHVQYFADDFVWPDVSGSKDRCSRVGIGMGGCLSNPHNSASSNPRSDTYIPMLWHLPSHSTPESFMFTLGLRPLVTAWVISAWRFSRSSSIKRVFFSINASMRAVSRSRWPAIVCCSSKPEMQQRANPAHFCHAG